MDRTFVTLEVWPGAVNLLNDIDIYICNREPLKDDEILAFVTKAQALGFDISSSTDQSPKTWLLNIPGPLPGITLQIHLSLSTFNNQ